MKRVLVLGAVIGVAGLAALGYNYFVGFPRSGTGSLLPGAAAGIPDTARSGTAVPVDYIVEPFVSGLEVPWSIVFTGPDRMLVTERPGRVRVIEDGVLRAEPLLKLENISLRAEEGLMGMTLHPDYESNRFVYLAYAYPDDSGMAVRVARYTDEGDRFADPQTILQDLPAARFHAGTALGFGPDGKLYVTVGDALDRARAQDPDALHGKLLRVNDDGSVPSDNPFSGSPVYSLGHRNAQGIAWHPETGTLYSSEHGPSSIDGPAGGDEINIIKAGGNYGWPEVSHERNARGFIAPMLVFTPALAPASGVFYSGTLIPQFTNNFFFGGLRGEGLYRVAPDPVDPEKVLGYEKLPGVDFGRIRAVAEGPDGTLYFATSNRDGRGSPAAEDDRIFRITAR